LCSEGGCSVNINTISKKTQKQVTVLQNKAQKVADKLNEEVIFGRISNNMVKPTIFGG
jgi:DNA-binding protein YbaB